MRKFSVRLFIALCPFVCLLYMYTRWIEPYWIETNFTSIDLLENGQDQIRILHISDLHASMFVKLGFINKAVALGISKKPDLIIITGDFFTGRLTPEFKNTGNYDTYKEILQRLSNFSPTYACLGNHDGGEWARFDSTITKNFLEDSKITVLHNENTRIKVKGTAITLIGLGDLWAEEFHSNKAFRNIAKEDNSVKIVLVHNPDAKERLVDYPWELMLSGHTHGGQFQLPVIGTPFAPVHDHRYVKGLKRWKGRWIHVTKGVGNLLGMRFNCRPEISLIDLGDTRLNSY